MLFRASALSKTEKCGAVVRYLRSWYYIQPPTENPQEPRKLKGGTKDICYRMLTTSSRSHNLQPAVRQQSLGVNTNTSTLCSLQFVCESSRHFVAKTLAPNSQHCHSKINRKFSTPQTTKFQFQFSGLQFQCCVDSFGNLKFSLLMFGYCEA